MDRINPRSTRDQIRSQEMLERNARAQTAVAANGGRSAPQASNSRPMGLSADWRETFATPPTPQPFFSRPPKISARDAALAASPEPWMPQGGEFNVAAPLTGPQGNAATDRANLGQSMAMASNPRAFVSPRATVAQVSVPNVRLDARLPAATVSATGITRNMPYDQTAARATLYKTHPGVFTAGTLENQLFAAHAKQFGEESAHQNIASLMSSASKLSGAGDRFVGNN